MDEYKPIEENGHRVVLHDQPKLKRRVMTCSCGEGGRIVPAGLWPAYAYDHIGGRDDS